MSSPFWLQLLPLGWQALKKQIAKIFFFSEMLRFAYLEWKINEKRGRRKVDVV